MMIERLVLPLVNTILLLLSVVGAQASEDFTVEENFLLEQAFELMEELRSHLIRKAASTRHDVQ